MKAKRLLLMIFVFLFLTGQISTVFAYVVNLSVDDDVSGSANISQGGGNYFKRGTFDVASVMAGNPGSTITAATANFSYEDDADFISTGAWDFSEQFIGETLETKYSRYVNGCYPNECLHREILIYRMKNYERSYRRDVDDEVDTAFVNILGEVYSSSSRAYGPVMVQAYSPTNWKGYQSSETYIHPNGDITYYENYKTIKYTYQYRLSGYGGWPPWVGDSSWDMSFSLTDAMLDSLALTGSLDYVVTSKKMSDFIFTAASLNLTLDTTPVPEPTSILLFLAGLAGVAGSRVRRNS